MKILFQLFTLLLMISSSYAADSASDLSTLLNGVKSLQGHFSQTIMDSHGKATQHSTGKMALQRPGKFRWEIDKPMPQLIIANQAKLWIYDPDLEQVTIRSIKGSRDETPGLLLSHDNTHLEKYFAISIIGHPKAGWQWFKLVPKKPENMFAAIQLGFFNQHLQAMKFADHLGNVTAIQFSQLQTNAKLSSSLFVFKAPPHVDVIDETRRK